MQKNFIKFSIKNTNKKLISSYNFKNEKEQFKLHNVHIIKTMIGLRVDFITTST